ncbi:MAG TPA: hypothetical protein VMD04_01560 [Candidatus Margulisiibacteriota bacterium]|nr:hypothetical protein [Candidatus Margulisiibacteriota bacterium]
MKEVVIILVGLAIAISLYLAFSDSLQSMFGISPEALKPDAVKIAPPSNPVPTGEEPPS